MEEDEERAARCGTGRGGASERGTETSEDRGTLTWEDRLREGQRPERGVDTEWRGVGDRNPGSGEEEEREERETQR